jgi:thiamine-phosphate diphosphorylase
MGEFNLYLVAGARHDLADAITAALRGGVTMVQLRFKDLDDRTVVDMAAPVAGICRQQRIPLIINDRIDIALVLDADGVHLGVDDLPIEAARKIAPPGFHIGYSPETDDQILTAAERGATYLGIGPVYGTTTKADAGSPLGILEFQRRRSLTQLPVVGIGGIDVTNAREVVGHGATGVALSSAILGANDIESATEALSYAVNQ